MSIVECVKSDELKKLIEDNECIVEFSAPWCTTNQVLLVF